MIKNERTKTMNAKYHHGQERKKAEQKKTPIAERKKMYGKARKSIPNKLKRIIGFSMMPPPPPGKS